MAYLRDVMVMRCHRMRSGMSAHSARSPLLWGVSALCGDSLRWFCGVPEAGLEFVFVMRSAGTVMAVE